MATVPPARNPAVVLLSGGLDSAICLAEAIESGFDACALSIDYGQRHRWELDAARRIADSCGALEHKLIAIDLRSFGGSALTDDISVPKDQEQTSNSATGQIPVTYVPARNLMFLSVATAYAESIGSRDIFIGVNAIDYSGYPDCRPAFIESFQHTANLGTKIGVEGGQVRIHSPLLHMSKADIVQRGTALGVQLELTLSCYDPQKTTDGVEPCQRCDACILRRNGFREAGVTDRSIS